MNFDKMTFSHHLRQSLRIGASRDRIAAREKAVADGRVVPDDGDLSIGRGRRLTAAVLFLDICSFSERPCETEDEQELMLRALTFFFEEMIAIVEEYDGVVEKNTGDGLMAYFPRGPAGATSEAQRAVSCALTMFHAAAKFEPVFQASDIEPFHFRIGIEHGMITVAEVGKARGFHGIVAVGTTANVACKMLKVAKKDEIVIGDRLAAELPPNWQGFVRQATNETGWVYRHSAEAYPFHKYTGRWVTPRLSERQ